MPSAFSLSGLIRLDLDLTNTATIGSVADTATILETLAYANGSGGGQANVYARFAGTLAAQGSQVGYTLSTLAVPTQTASTYNVAISKLRLAYLKNNHAAQRIRLGFYDSSVSELWAIEVRGGGAALWSCGSGTVSDTEIVAVVVTAVDVAGNAPFDLVLAGVKP